MFRVDGGRVLTVIGIVVLVSSAIRLQAAGRRRVLPRPWMNWLPFAAPVAWAIGAVMAELLVARQAANLDALAPDARATALTEGIADALYFMLGGGLVAGVVLLGCTTYFSTRPLAPPPGDDT